MASTRRTTLLLVAIAASAIGCGSKPTAANNKELSHLRAVTALYFQANSRLGKNPTSAEEFKESIAAGNPDWSKLGVSGPDELFISERDGKPLVILYGPSKSGPFGAVAYEQEGLNGVRLVGMINGQVQEADAAQFAKLVPKPATP
jgi:hypothetical protein